MQQALDPSVMNRVYQSGFGVDALAQVGQGRTVVGGFAVDMHHYIVGRKSDAQGFENQLGKGGEFGLSASG